MIHECENADPAGPLGRCGSTDDVALEWFTIAGVEGQLLLCRGCRDQLRQVTARFMTYARAGRPPRDRAATIDAHGRMWSLSEVRWVLTNVLRIDVPDRARLHPIRHERPWLDATRADPGLLVRVRAAIEDQVVAAAKKALPEDPALQAKVLAEYAAMKAERGDAS